MSKTKLGPQTLLFPMPAVLVGARVGETPNFMTVAWCGIASHEPPAISVAIHKNRHTLKGIRENGAFSVNVASVTQVKTVDTCGIYSGARKDKSALFSVFHGNLDGAPLIRECPVNLECRVLHELDLGSHCLVVGEILETHVTESCLADGKPDPAKIDPLVYLPGVREYAAVGATIAKAFKIGKEEP